MTLGNLIEFLERRDKSIKVPLGLGETMSYRGIYSELAFAPTENTTVGAMLKEAKEALGKTYSGYKGGDYPMHDGVDCYIANYGECGEEIGEVLLKYMVGEY